MIGAEDDKGFSPPIPHAYFKSVLTENDKGALNVWSFFLPHKQTSKPLNDFLTPTIEAERLSGLFLWARLVGTKIKREKRRVRKM